MLPFHPLMAPQKPFYIAKLSFGQIDGAWDVQFRVAFVGEQVRQMPFQAVGAS